MFYLNDSGTVIEKKKIMKCLLEEVPLYWASHWEKVWRRNGDEVCASNQKHGCKRENLNGLKQS